MPRKFTSLLTGLMLSAVATQAATPMPAGQSSGASSLYGYMGYSEAEDFVAGLYNFTLPGYSMTWADPIYQDATMSLQSGWLRNGRICGFIPYYYLSQLVTVIYVEMDLETGYPYIFEDNDITDGAYEICAYNSSDNHIYGYAFDGAGDWWFMRSPADRPFDMEKIKSLPTQRDERQLCSALTWDEKDKTLYGVNADNKLVTITPQGKQNEVMQLSEYSLPYISGLCRSASDDRLYWNATIKAPGYLNEVSYLYTIQPDMQKAAEIDEFENSEQFMFLIDTDKSYPSDNPAEAITVSTDFKDGESSGTVTFALPANTVGGEALNGPVSWMIRLDGDKFDEGNSTAGTQVKAELSDLSEGMHYIALTPSCDGKSGASAYTEVYVGIDTPSSPTGVSLTKESVTWDAVTTGQHGGYIDASKVKYKVYINDILEATTTDTRIPVSISTTLPLTRYQAKVEAIADGKTSTPALSNPIVEGAPLQLDVQIEPTAKQVALMLTDDVNADGYGWTFDPEDVCLVADYSETEPMDDWIFMPAIDFPDKDVLYEVNLEAISADSRYAGELFEVAFGDEPTPEAMTTKVIARTNPDAWGYTTYRGLFSINQPMKGYIGIHACSLTDQYGMKFRNINILRTNIGSSVSEMADGMMHFSVSALEGSIRIEGAPGGKYEVYTTDGMLRASGQLTDSPSYVDVSSGMYLVRSAGQTAKVLVR